MGTTLGQPAAVTRVGWQWLWVVAGFVMGVVLLGTIVPIVLEIPPRPDVAILVGALTLVLMGVLVGYHSKGRTLLEPGGAGLALAASALLYAGLGTEIAPAYWVIALPAGAALGAAGGHIGEVLQESVESGPVEGVHWGWVLAGTVLGVVLNTYAVFIPRGLLGWTGFSLLATFAGSFFLVGFLVGYLSPGVTILEPALAALCTIVVDLALVLVGFGVPFPIFVAAFAAVVAFGVALAGGYTGEVAHALHFRSSMGGAEGEFRRTPRPGE